MKPISKTAFYCCGVRMQDAQSPAPVCGDHYAKLFMNERGLQIFEAFKAEKMANANCVARARLIDDHLRRELASNPDLLVVTIGAGFDSRPFRLTGGMWLELDEPAVISYKNQRLPVADCPNRLQRIAIDFASDSLAEKLAPFSGHGSIVCVVEGVLSYLDPSASQHLVHVLRSVFPKHKLICDLMTRRFLNTYGRSMRSKISAIGATLTAVDEPERLFDTQSYRMLYMTSISRGAIELGLIRLPRFLLNVLPMLASGYAVYLFEA
ncbi:class I SAM-dependent methyltransferase [Dyella tabacisoli]|uniref:Class I SAM-dependent methyltransferase n=1 Tax=Dyella tabacisoli TaxID=2282381 RepID=A0A369UMK0_9GAMM|nr:class I SAM-dependent methyltransferase [Dyella tabacisoli]RDD81305.1 hypothetical protein DVJ77_13435 [Dyella tabacisoli]